VSADEPENMTVRELAVFLGARTPDEIKSAERWIKDRLMPGHPERLPHTRLMRNRPTFTRQHRTEILARYDVAGAADAERGPMAEVIEIDSKTLARARAAHARAVRAAS
jgi:hypothetical protein